MLSTTSVESTKLTVCYFSHPSNPVWPQAYFLLKAYIWSLQKYTSQNNFPQAAVEM